MFAQNGSAPSKERMDQERHLLSKFSPVLKKYVEGEEVETEKGKKKGGENPEIKRQISLIYALQVFCHQQVGRLGQISLGNYNDGNRKTDFIIMV
jgi:hypothetical protein